MAVIFFFGIDGANEDVINAFVLQGFPTTNTFTVFFAYSSNALPYY
jgi:hypothetical protein